jgi:hypothetical protein
MIDLAQTSGVSPPSFSAQPRLPIPSRSVPPQVLAACKVILNLDVRHVRT